MFILNLFPALVGKFDSPTPGHYLKCGDFRAQFPKMFMIYVEITVKISYG